MIDIDLLGGLLDQMIKLGLLLAHISILELIEIGKVPIQVDVVSIVTTSHPVLAAALLKHVASTSEEIGRQSSELMLHRIVPTVRIHGRQDVNASRVYETHDVLVAAQVALAQLMDELDEHLATDHFVAVHVADVLELGLERLVLARLVREHDHAQRLAERALQAQVVHVCDVWAALVDALDEREQLFVRVVVVESLGFRL